MAVYEVVMHGDWNNAVQVATVRHYSKELPFGNINASLQAIGSLFQGTHGPLLSRKVSYNSISIRNVEVGSVGYSYTPTGWPFTGDREGDDMPPFVAFRIDLFGTELLKPYRGYVRLPGVLEEDNFEGKLIGDAPSLLSDAADFYQHVFTGADPTIPVLWSRSTGITNVISRASINADISTQNSRKFGRGA